MTEAETAGSAHSLPPVYTLVPTRGIAGRFNPGEKGWPGWCLGFGTGLAGMFWGVVGEERI